MAAPTRRTLTQRALTDLLDGLVAHAALGPGAANLILECADRIKRDALRSGFAAGAALFGAAPAEAAEMYGEWRDLGAGDEGGL